ncbi:MAG TPA: hypothetical protein VFN10_12345 [Thermoanaerobaculia bacterium]|nr:hypothetical protein [Thermoanaerobaculia bacterium]
MIISVVNHSNRKVKDKDLQTVIRAINRQITEDFAPYWSMSATLRLEGRSMNEPDKVGVADMRGDAILYIWDKSDVDGALGYHFANNRGIPYGFVFLDVAEAVGESWTVTLSHEALELLADPEGNLLVIGPHPSADQNRFVFHWFEMCDAVQADTYTIDGVEVSNFVLPLYFTGSRDEDEPGARNDFLGTVKEDDQTTLPSFGINKGGYVGFYDPLINDHVQFTLENDAAARSRVDAKKAIKVARRTLRIRDEQVRTGVMANRNAAMLRIRGAAAPAEQEASVVPASPRATTRRRVSRIEP